jgi:hypothetical protein
MFPEQCQMFLERCQMFPERCLLLVPGTAYELMLIQLYVLGGTIRYWFRTYVILLYFRTLKEISQAKVVSAT